MSVRFYEHCMEYHAAILSIPYDNRKNLRSFLGQNDYLKLYVVLMITVGCPYEDCVVLL